MLQTFNFIAGGRQADARADFFRYESCAANGADESVRVRADGNDLGLFLPGDFCNLPVFATRWEVLPVTGTATGTFRLGVGVVGSSRLTGIVKVIDQSFDKTLSGNQFFGGTANSADAVNQSIVSIRLSAAGQAAGKRISVKKLILSSPSAGDFMLNGGSNTGTSISGVVASAFNKLIPGSGPSAILNGNIAAPSIALAAGEMAGAFQLGGRLSVAASTVFIVPFSEPIVITGTGVLAVLGITANRQVNATFEWEES